TSKPENHGATSCPPGKRRKKRSGTGATPPCSTTERHGCAGIPVRRQRIPATIRQSQQSAPGRLAHPEQENGRGGGRKFPRPDMQIKPQRGSSYQPGAPPRENRGNSIEP